MLTTDRYFVFHPLDNDKGKKLIDNWRAAYEVLKDTDWKKDPEAVAKEHDAVIRKYLDPKGLPGKHKVNHDNSVLRFMTYFEATFGQGLTPFTSRPGSSATASVTPRSTTWGRCPGTAANTNRPRRSTTTRCSRSRCPTARAS